MFKSENKNAKVFFRIFPLEKITWDFLKIRDKTMYIRHLQELADESNTKGKPKFWEFKTDGIFFNSSQEYVYAKVMDDMLDRVIKGYNGIITAYGQTGTGKTVTLGGLQLSLEDLGIIPRIIYDLLKLKKELPKNIKMCIQISYMEFSKSTATDLLKEYPNFIDMYKSREATKIKVTNEYEALKLIYKGEGRKTFGTNNTYLSNLCTSVVTFHITTKNMDYSSPQKTTSRLHVVDMVGVDTVGNISSFFKNSYEIGKANLIKTNLEQFLLCLLKNIPSQTKLKERVNPLIYFLGSDLSGESILRFIGHIRVLKRDIMITISMLRFGQLVRGLKPKIKEITHEVNEETQIQYLQNELNRLQKDQVHCSVLLNQDLTNNLNQDRIEHIQRTIKKYLNEQISEINILNVAEAFSVFKEFKEICNQLDTDRCRLNEELQIELTKYRRDSKSSSRSSLRGSKIGIRRMSKKSRDSFVSIDDKKKKEENLSPQYSPMNARRQSSAASKPLKKDSVVSGGGAQVTKKRSSVGITKRTSVNRKKSVASTSITDKLESRSFLNEINLMPEIIPEYREAWDIYVNDPESSYRTMLDNFITNANDMQRVYGIYLTQMKLLQQCKQIAEKRKNDVFEARMIRSFNDTYRSTHSDEDVVPGSTEKLCEDNLNTAKNSLAEQQEVVLKWQAELKICLNTRREMKNSLNENFENYCKEKYKVPIPNLSEDEEVIQNITLDIKTKEMDEVVIGEEKEKSMFNDRILNINNLRKIMRRALLKDMKLKANKNLTWKNSALRT